MNFRTKRNRGNAGNIFRDALKVQGYFSVVKRDVDGKVLWEQPIIMNGVTTLGLNSILNVYFGGSGSYPQFNNWYFGLIDSASFTTGLAAGDTLASHGGWAENSNYSGNRPAFTPSAASGGSISSSGPATVTMNATVTIKGSFLCTVNSGTSGTLWATGLFATAQSLTSGQSLSFNYTLPLTATS